LSQNLHHLFTDIFYRWTTGFGSMFQFKQIAELGLPYAKHDVIRQNLGVVRFLQANPEYLQKDEQGKPRSFDENATVQQVTEMALSNAKASVQSASLVFAHSVVDTATMDYCECTRLAAPGDWEPHLDNKEVTLSKQKLLTLREFRGLTYDAVFQRLLSKAFSDLKATLVSGKIAATCRAFLPICPYM
jgi:hypothetical protein